MSQQAVKFAYWVPNVSGGLVVSKIEQRTHWGIDYNRKLAQLAEAAGFEYALTQIRFTAGYGAEFQHESVAFSHAHARFRCRRACRPDPMACGAAAWAPRQRPACCPT